MAAGLEKAVGKAIGPGVQIRVVYFPETATKRGPNGIEVSDALEKGWHRWAQGGVVSPHAGTCLLTISSSSPICVSKIRKPLFA
jgi:hypothetical protein